MSIMDELRDYWDRLREDGESGEEDIFHVLGRKLTPATLTAIDKDLRVSLDDAKSDRVDEEWAAIQDKATKNLPAGHPGRVAIDGVELTP